MNQDKDNRYYGKYRGTVVSNLDPENRGRIMAIVPDVQGMTPTTFAMPCVPAAGKGSGAYFVPEIGAGVWIEFEQGDPDYPIWTGCFWGVTAELPEMGIASPPPTPNMVFQTTGRNSITVFGVPGGGLMLCSGPVSSPSSPRILITQAGITLTTGQATITLNGSAITMVGSPVTVNAGALVVT
jgi:hypothetical protein